MTNLLVYNYYYRYKQFRKNIKDNLVDAQNYVEARNQLQNIIAEHQSKFPDSDTRRDFNFGEKIIMEHAKRHLNEYVDATEKGVLLPPVLKMDGITIETQEEIIKNILLYQGKADYSDV
jgi:hypothetical protein